MRGSKRPAAAHVAAPKETKMTASTNGKRGTLSRLIAAGATVALLAGAAPTLAQTRPGRPGAARELPQPILDVDRSASTITVGMTTYRVDANSRLLDLEGNPIGLGDIRLLPPRERMNGPHAKVVVDRSSSSTTPLIRELRMVPGLSR